MGITTRLANVYSLALGSGEVTLFDMVKAYGVLANQGTRLEPYAVERIEDRSGRVLETHVPSSYEAIPPATAYVVTSMLQSVIDGGTGWAARAWGFDYPAAGKTGNDQRLHGRLVHRIHAARGLRRLGRLRRQALDGHRDDGGQGGPAGLD